MPRAHVRFAILAMSTALLLSACASHRQLESNYYERGQPLTPLDVTFGRIASVRKVTIGGTESGLGGGALSVIGTVAGLAVGASDATKLIAAITGGSVGGKGGQHMEEKFTREDNAVEVVVATCAEPPKYIAVVQLDGFTEFKNAYEANASFNPRKPQPPADTQKPDPSKVSVKETSYSKSERTVAGVVISTVVKEEVATSLVPAPGISSGNAAMADAKALAANVQIISDPNKKVQPRAVLCNPKESECHAGCSAQAKSKPAAEAKP